MHGVSYSLFLFSYQLKMYLQSIGLLGPNHFKVLLLKYTFAERPHEVNAIALKIDFQKS